MPDQIHTVVDEIRLSTAAFDMAVVNDLLYCSGRAIRRIDLSSKDTTEIAPNTESSAMALVDFHRPFDLPPDLVGAGAPDRRIYVSVTGAIGEIIPVLGQFRKFPIYPHLGVDPFPSDVPYIPAMVGSHGGKHLYFFDFDAQTIGVVDLDRPDPATVASIQLGGFTASMVVSPDDRFIYAGRFADDLVSVIDTSIFPPSVTSYPVGNDPYGLALSADGNRLFVAQAGGTNGPSDYGTGTLTVFDTATMRGSWLYTGKGSSNVIVNAAGTRAYVSNSGENTISVVEVTASAEVAVGLEVIDTVTGLTNPWVMRFSADERQLYVSLFGSQPSDDLTPPVTPPSIAVVAI